MEPTPTGSPNEPATMGPPPPKKPNSNNTAPPPDKSEPEKEQRPSSVPYTIPEWSGPPCHQFFLEVLKDGSIIDQFNVFEKGAYMFGRIDLCDFVLDHPTISRFHAVLQFKRSGQAYIYDLGSTHGTFINKHQVDKRTYVELHVGDVIRFGHSSRLYIFQGPADLMPPEIDAKIVRDAKIQQQMIDREASLQRARMDTSLANGVSWGMGEDAIEEDEDEADEVTWQTYKGQLTEKQEKTRDKVLKRTEKIAHMRKEIDAIRAKEISQGGLTQGQQTQIARNEQRITQLMEELENLEETLNESIRESIGARAGNRRSCGNVKGAAEDDDGDFLSDDDEFYDRTKKPTIKQGGEPQSIETADTLLDKRDTILKEMEDKRELLSIEKRKMPTETGPEAGDALDAYMSGLSSQLVQDKTIQLDKELSALQAELDRILFLLKFADPSGEAARKRELNVLELKHDKVGAPPAANKKKIATESAKNNVSSKQSSLTMQKNGTADAGTDTVEPKDNSEADKTINDTPVCKSVYTVVKPQWLGAVEDKEVKETARQEVSNLDESDQFVDYKDRQKILQEVSDVQVKMDSTIESAPAGLILRKRKETERPRASDNEDPDQSKSSMETKFSAEDAVALLLKHTKGLHADEEGEKYDDQKMFEGSQPCKDNKRPKRVLGPEKPSFINSSPEYDSWVPPEGQSGDGRTSLNDRYGY
ncbi:hypothetical protein K2173_025932 [Erythroxylum novogranatense]|uniref:FHA domain-containing protein n=1 Tax=Erythroxylum novogranatense TaxID=1862640 RepID=A0AAV8SHP7_9ROSI|nr:hypothetical protein K2173_025932 [Erythroxylum novogranatense]